jgi:hypothetical protein
MLASRMPLAKNTKADQNLCDFCVLVAKFQSKAQQVKIKNPFFQIFFYPFSHNDLAKTAPPKTPYFSHQTRISALTKEGSYYI